MSSNARRPASAKKTTGNSSRPGSSGSKRTEASSRPGSMNKNLPGNGVRNKSNSVAVNEKSQLPGSAKRAAPSKVGNVEGKIKILGQDAVMSEMEIWNLNGLSSGKSSPLSSRNSTFRTPTPSRQISLPTVKRKEEKTEPIETIDWNDFVRPISLDEERPNSMLDDRFPTPELTDSDESDKDSGMTMEDRLMLVEKRAQEMTSALSSRPLNDTEENLSKQLERVELEREEHDRLEKERLEKELIMNKERQNNENFRDFGPKTPRSLITDSDIVGANSKTGSISVILATSREPDITAQGHGASSGDSFTGGARPKVTKGETSFGQKSVVQEQRAGTSEDVTYMKQLVATDSKDTLEKAEDTSSSDEENDDEDDLIGRKGKAPNELLMEFLDCMMKQEYTTAEKLCRMILIYEPNNAEALNFLPLIQEKIKQEEEEDEEDSDDESGSDDEDDDDDDDDDEDDDDDDEDDDDEEEEDSSEESEEQERVPDSGVVSAANSD